MENLNHNSKREVFCRYIRKNGKVIYPKNATYFHFLVDDIPSDEQKKQKVTETKEKKN